MAKNIHVYLINCITNLHVGSGDGNYGVIDNLVQRDITTDYPTINSSSLKGALREFWVSKRGADNDCNHIFGSENTGKSEKGKYTFLPADCLSLAVRSSGVQPFVSATCDEAVKVINEKLKFLTSDSNDGLISGDYSADLNEPVSGFSSNSKFDVEDYACTKFDGNFDENIGDHPVVFNNQDFAELAKELPINARNKLNNGISENLWYEQLVPHHSRFIAIVISEENEKHQFETFDNLIQSSNVQIGANASIGYGICRFKNIGNYEA